MDDVDRQRDVRAVWSWLPAFRAIAETEHLPTAAALVGVTPPALSRTLRLLEDHLGQPLFHRRGRRLELAPAGAALRAAVRDAMRRVHDGLSELEGGSLVGPVMVAASGLVVPYVTQELVAFAADVPGVQPELVVPLDVRADLLAGRLDVAFQTATVVDPKLVTELLGEEPSSIWCGPGHPLFGQVEATVDAVLAHAFVAPPPLPSGQAAEGWPDHLNRHVSLRVHRMDIGADVAAQGAHLAVLPDVTARSTHQQLWRVPVDITPAVPVYAVRRQARAGAASAPQVLVDRVRARLLQTA